MFFKVRILVLICKTLKIFLLIYVFFVATGMKLILRDGNFIEVNRYNVEREKIFFEKNGKKFFISLKFVDINSTKKLAELEGKQFSIFSLSSSILKEKVSDKGLFFRRPALTEKSEKKDFRIKLETRKETNPFLLEQPKPDEQDEDFIEKIKKKGVILKIEVPIKR